MGSQQTVAPLLNANGPACGVSTVATLIATSILDASQPTDTGVLLKADDDNTGNIYIGKAGVTVLTGWRLKAGQSLRVSVGDVSLIYAIASASSQKLAWGTELQGVQGSVAPASPFITGLLAGWKLDEAAGATRLDVLSLHNLADHNTVGQGAGVSGFAATFNGSNQYLSNASPIVSNGPFSVEAWFLLTNTSSRETFWSQGVASPLQWFGYDDAQGGIGFSASAPDTGCIGDPVAIAELHHAIGTFDGTTASIYIDGVLNFSQADTYAAGATNTALGAAPGGGSNRLNGRLHSVYLWSRCLTAGEVTTRYNGGVRKDYPF